MVLRPIHARRPPPTRGCIPAWDAIAPAQTEPGTDYWLITQPDHAALAGAMAAALGPPLLPQLEPAVVEGIAAHDDGWAPFDAQPKVVNGRPLSFLEFLPRDFIVAWNGSIENAEKVAPIAGAIVSRHFWRLGRARADGKVDAPEDSRLLVQFLETEERRQDRLLGSRPRGEFEFLTDVLQFCDVLSLYLCCGAEQDVAFPQKFGPKPIQLRREAARHPDQAAVCRFDPSPFREGGLDIAVAARRFPPECRPSTTTLPFLLW